MKYPLFASIASIAFMGTAYAAPIAALDMSVTTNNHSALTDVAWVGRYGQLCFHGPVWIPACHATDMPVGYIQGHWNPTGTRFIPGRYY